MLAVAQWTLPVGQGLLAGAQKNGGRAVSYNGYFVARVIVDRAATQGSKATPPAPAPAKPNP